LNPAKVKDRKSAVQEGRGERGCWCEKGVLRGGQSQRGGFYGSKRENKKDTWPFLMRRDRKETVILWSSSRGWGGETEMGGENSWGGEGVAAAVSPGGNSGCLRVGGRKRGRGGNVAEKKEGRWGSEGTMLGIFEGNRTHQNQKGKYGMGAKEGGFPGGGRGGLAGICPHGV